MHQVTYTALEPQSAAVLCKEDDAITQSSAGLSNSLMMSMTLNG